MLVAFCLLMISLSWWVGRYVEERNANLSEQARAELRGYAREAEQAWLDGGQAGADRWLAAYAEVHPDSPATLVGADLQPLGSQPLSAEMHRHMTFLRGVDWPVSRHSKTLPWLRLDFPGAPQRGSLVLQLPAPMLPGRYALAWQLIINGLLPGLLTLLFCAGLYRLLIRPLNLLREQANAWRADPLGVRLSPAATTRKDELGELGRAFDQLSERLQGTVALQHQLLRDLSHELRTPLSRLKVAGDSELDGERLRQRLVREVDGMQRLVEDTLQLAWLDAERSPRVPEPIQVQALWELVAENACFETRWPAARLLCTVPAECWVLGDLDTLAQALENILRNAIRHSPSHGRIGLHGQLQGEQWLLWLDDEGGGVAAEDLERIFDPFIRLDGSRPGDGGFGLGLSIARNALQAQGGALWAQNTRHGLRLNLRLRRAVEPSPATVLADASL
ncbi:histidine kinase sensor domain-containing protein [Pseudomonas sp. HR96]|uniref:histidine kinase sensor domain-containing protein n=1 Tax=Pseudomonas sp. HR96 TaxID=1027966 RepID=UPI002A766274|nr:histidine kinase sensor domain-containing protein [Pseudomonas sp. HR96]WPP02298.1 histidine kinase sensor domain-containing protein [Pseudomonas sp. HR96]